MIQLMYSSPQDQWKKLNLLAKSQLLGGWGQKDCIESYNKGKKLIAKGVKREKKAKDMDVD